MVWSQHGFESFDPTVLVLIQWFWFWSNVMWLTFFIYGQRTQVSIESTKFWFYYYQSQPVIIGKTSGGLETLMWPIPRGDMIPIGWGDDHDVTSHYHSLLTPPQNTMGAHHNHWWLAMRHTTTIERQWRLPTNVHRRPAPPSMHGDDGPPWPLMTSMHKGPPPPPMNGHEVSAPGSMNGYDRPQPWSAMTIDDWPWDPPPPPSRNGNNHPQMSMGTQHHHQQLEMMAHHNLWWLAMRTSYHDWQAPTRPPPPLTNGHVVPAPWSTDGECPLSSQDWQMAMTTHNHDLPTTTSDDWPWDPPPRSRNGDGHPWMSMGAQHHHRWMEMMAHHNLWWLAMRASYYDWQAPTGAHPYHWRMATGSQHHGQRTMTNAH